ncbi:MAG: xanthine dehydrogenase family protein subunit M [Candidatus Rokubacteria bacterium]|nr:xanthine dehydrogenase family protein subunit M [Candidatus Rokubacteria bacterium]
MKPAPFAYHDPRSVDEVVDRLAEHGDDAKVLAGGQSLMPMLALRLARPAVIVDLNRVGGLDDVRASDGGVLHLGALVRQRAIERWATTPAPLLSAALRMVGHVAIRTRGTVAGSVTHADPAAELPALFAALDGVVVARSRQGERTIPASELYVGPLTTSLRSDEVVVETRWPLPPAHAGWGFHEVARRHGDFALVGVFAVVTVSSGRIDAARIALFGVGPTPVRARDAEQSLAGAAVGAEAIGDAARLAADALDPDSDLHASAWYRKRVARTLTERALTDALSRARSSR